MNTTLANEKTREVRLDFETALARAKTLLAEQGFRVRCEINVGETLRAKIGDDCH